MCYVWCVGVFGSEWEVCGIKDMYVVIVIVGGWWDGWYVYVVYEVGVYVGFLFIGRFDGCKI